MFKLLKFTLFADDAGKILEKLVNKVKLKAKLKVWDWFDFHK